MPPAKRKSSGAGDKAGKTARPNVKSHDSGTIRAENPWIAQLVDWLFGGIQLCVLPDCYYCCHVFLTYYPCLTTSLAFHSALRQCEVGKPRSASRPGRVSFQRVPNGGPNSYI